MNLVNVATFKVFIGGAWLAPGSCGNILQNFHRTDYEDLPVQTIPPGAAIECGTFLVTNHGDAPATFWIEGGHPHFNGSNCMVDGRESAR